MANIITETLFQEIFQQGQALYEKDDLKRTIRLYKIALNIAKFADKSKLAEIYLRLGDAFFKLEDIDKSAYYYKQYLKECPEGQPTVFSKLAKAYYYIDSDKSIEYHSKALNMEINLYDSSSILFSMIKSASYTQKEVKEKSEYVVEQLKNTLFKNIKQYKHDDKKKKRNKKLNIGYFSSDCYAHTMMNYILPIWKNHNREEFNFFVFNGSDKRDFITEDIEKLGFTIVNCAQMALPQIAKAIYDNQIDILIDIGGYTHTKTYAILYKPAPIIMTYLGYLNTLGMKEVDYIITDKYSIPDEKSCLYTEKPLYLGNSYQIFDKKILPEIQNCPFKKNGYITFGSFNCTSKLNDKVFDMWSKILQKIPNSKLFIYRSKLTDDVIKYLKTKMKEFEIKDKQVIISNKQYDAYHHVYSLVDISLDPYPFSGMSIAIETALMGVPTITLVGEGMQSRGAGRINHIIGLEEVLNASFGDEYVQKAVDLALNKEKLQELRKTLREKINSSSLKQNPAEFTRILEENYKQAWLNFVKSH